MATIKKAYTDIVELLQANADAVVSEMLPQVIALASAKTGGGGGRATTFHKIDDVIVGIRCFYFGKWMKPGDGEDGTVEFGKKASSATGFNSMCKEGVSHWTKQQRVAKAAKEKLLEGVASGDIESTDLTSLLADIEEARGEVAEFEGEAFDTIEELLESLA